MLMKLDILRDKPKYNFAAVELQAIKLSYTVVKALEYSFESSQAHS